jgi:hypothetical protein
LQLIVHVSYLAIVMVVFLRPTAASAANQPAAMSAQVTASTPTDSLTH